mmetsp:Transcript_14091/g.17555  ORF Transcript_14091/g.17555 Transcript_14091/m.17555 type:complete len:482 (+) Transcript_14091:67-1512(+)
MPRRSTKRRSIGESNKLEMSSRARLWESLWQESEEAGNGSVLDRMKLGLLSRGMRWEEIAADSNLLAQHRQNYDLGLPRAQRAWISYRRAEITRNIQDSDSSNTSSSEDDDTDGLSDDESFFTEEEEDDNDLMNNQNKEEENQVLEHIFKDVPRTYSGLWIETEPFSTNRQLDTLSSQASFSLVAKKYFKNYLPLSALNVSPLPTKKQKRRRERILAHLLILASKKFGYCQGMNFVCAAIVLENEKKRSPRDAYALYAYLLKELKLDRLYGRSLASYLGALRCCLEREVPNIAKLFEALNFEPQLYAVEWFSALFTVSVPKALSLCILDLIFVQFRDAPLRLAVGILKANEKEILALEPNFDVLVANFKRIIRNTHVKTAILAAIACAPAFPTCDVLNALAAPAIPASRFLPPAHITTKQPDVDTPYGPGVIAKVRKESTSSNDDASAILVVNLDWGATAYLENHQVEKKTNQSRRARNPS